MNSDASTAAHLSTGPKVVKNLNGQQNLNFFVEFFYQYPCG